MTSVFWWLGLFDRWVW